MARDGVIDLRDWDLQTDGPVNLTGEWEIYWKKHLSANQFKSPVRSELKPLYINVPGLWNNVEYRGKHLPGSGFATYRLRVLLKEKEERLSLKLLDVSSAFRVYINDTLVSSAGVPGKVRSETVPAYSSEVAVFENTSPVFDIIFHVSNFHHRLGGVWKPVFMGKPSRIYALREKKIVLSVFMFGIITIMGVYHMGLYWFRRKDRSTLFFGAFCLIVAVRTVSHGERYILTLFPDMAYRHILWLIYLSFYLSVPAFVLYFRSIFPRDFPSKLVRFTLVVSALFTLSVLLLPIKVFTYTILAYQLFTAGLLICGFIVLYQIIHKKRRGSLIFLLGFLAIFLGAINDILFAFGVIWTAYLFHYALLFFIFCQAMLIFKRFSSAFDTVERQQNELKTEVVERQKIQKSLIESEERFRILSRGTFEAVVVHDDGRIRQANPQYYEMFGFTPQELAGKDAIVLTVTSDSVDVIKSEIARGSLGPYEATGRRKNGTEFPIEVQVSMIEYEGGMRRMAAIRDLSDRKRLEAEKRALERRITGGFAHEMRNALSGAQLAFKDAVNYQGKGRTSSKELKTAATSLLKSVSEIHERYQIPKTTIASDFIPQLKIIDQVSDTLAEIHSGVAGGIERGLAITNKIREYAMMSDLKKSETPVDILEMLKAYREQFCSEFEKHDIRYLVNGPDTCVLKADKTHLYSMFSNVILNAKDALAECDIDSRQINVTVERIDGWITVVFQDNGPGIQKKHLKEIFEPFFSTKPTTGTGLGLSIVQRLAGLYNCRIAVETIEGRGTEFKLVFPEPSHE